MSDSNNSAVSVAARIRKFMPWEEHDVCYEIEGEASIGLPAKKKGSAGERSKEMHFMQFNNVFDRKTTNMDVFNGTAKKLCDNMLETGFNSLLFAYGQTGSGKTYTLLGNPGKNDGIKGVLGYAIDYLLNHESGKVAKCSMAVNEAYGLKQNKVLMYDLYDKSNVVDDWSKKDGKRDLNKDDIVQKEITKTTNVSDLIALAQSAAHYAPTGKNPQSSRGHTAFIINVEMVDGHRCNFVCMDLAGSEGITAITPEFTQKVGKETAKVRLMEGGAINFGLSQLQALLREVGTKDGVHKTQGGGLRKLVWPFLQKANQPMINVLFTLSPSSTNIDTTRDTFRVATTMANLKIKPVRVQTKKTSQQIIVELKKKIREQDWKISKLEEEIVTLKDGACDDDNNANNGVMALQRQLTRQVSSVNKPSGNMGNMMDAINEDNEEHEHVVYNLNDLNNHKGQLVQLQRQITQQINSIQAKGNNANGLDHEELGELKEELSELNEEIVELDDNIDVMKTFEKEMESAINADKRTNSVFNRKLSKGVSAKDFKSMLGDVQEDQYQETDDEEEEEEENQSESQKQSVSNSGDEYVRIKKMDLLYLKEQLDVLAANAAEKNKKFKLEMLI